ncbi:RhoGAP-domain-containing protein [Hesseltinella vesiculosa]|uniref:RhoGAP-domain-containing protein n=1 Tax=Hesseltinella vesiculosa TaxID=101127 RepID=A0A1X2G8X1_9FUNG|nr:RhoGAP-domain-containing protein [Hesseltinella vesiculosa]
MGDHESDSHSTSSFVSYTDVEHMTQQLMSTNPFINDATTVSDLKQMLVAEKARSKEMEIKLEKYKALANQDNDKSTLFVEQMKKQLGLNIFYSENMASRLQQTCMDLRYQREQLMRDIEDSAFPVMKNSFQIQLSSLQKDVTDAQHNIEQLNQARDHALEEMILLNTKNAELNEMNNDLTRHVAQREKEAKAFMASTQFIRPSHSTDTSSTSMSVTGHMECLSSPVATTPASSIQRSSSSSSSSTSNTHTQQPRSSGESSSRIFQRSRNVLASINPMQLHKRKPSSDSKIDKPSPIHTLTVPPPLPSHSSPQPLSATTNPFLMPNPGQPTHTFVETKISSESCSACQKFIKRSHEVKCQVCMLPCHVKCIPNLDQPCNTPMTTDAPRMSHSPTGSVFSRDISEQAKLDHQLVPLIVKSCIEAIDHRGLTCEGLYRKSGRATETRALQQALDQQQRLDLMDQNAWPDIHAIASVLKSYFRSIPNPLFPFESYDVLLDATSQETPESAIQNLKAVMNSLPVENLATIRFVLAHLDRVQQHSDENRMVTKNLAMLFGPTLIRHRDEHVDLTDMNRKIHVLDFMLRHLDDLIA